MATPNGLEPSTSSVTGWRANRLLHRAKFGGNNRARTCDLLLVRQMLSQLSYAPILASSVLHTSATWFIIHINPSFVKGFFRFFYLNFTEAIPVKNLCISASSELFLCCFHSRGNRFLYRFAIRPAISSGVNSYTVSQNWQDTGKVLPSSKISCNSFLPRLISAEVTLWRSQ